MIDYTGITLLFHKYINISKAVQLNVGAKIFQIISNLVNILLIGYYLNSEEQGYYYTFGSILGIQIFFELGVVNIITQYVAHEKAHLKWENNVLVGSLNTIGRISSIFKIVVYWFSGISAFLFIILSISGFYFFSNFNISSVRWEIPWILLSIGTVFLFFYMAIIAFIEGLNKVEHVAKLRFAQNIIQSVFQILLFICNAKLYAWGISILLSTLWGYFAVFKYDRHYLLHLWKQFHKTNTINWYQEVFPYQWRTAISAISGYFIFQLFNPFIFITEGAIMAGKFGMTLTIASGISSIGQVWIKTHIPHLITHIALKKFKLLDKEFYLLLGQSLVVVLIGFITFSLLAYHFFSTISFGKKLLPLFPSILLFLNTIIQFVIFCLASYLRAHKQEPYLVISILNMFLCIVMFSIPQNIQSLCMFYLINNMICLCGAIYIFSKKKIQWQNE
jgi:O-antigen/teichoic acid export membrane protein